MGWRDVVLSGRGTAGAINALLATLVLFDPAYPSEEFKNKTEYDGYFLQYSNRYFGSHFDWRYFKAQAIVESRLRPEAQSRDGAMGIMQILPRTFQEITRQNPHISSEPKHPKWNIAAGIYYNRLMWNEWHGPLSVQDRLSFMFASYNAGRTNIQRAHRIAAAMGLDPKSWKSVERVLFQVTGSWAQVTAAYVRKVHDTWLALQ
jgi:membrane-bound lytic murein transglycosylase F